MTNSSPRPAPPPSPSWRHARSWLSSTQRPARRWLRRARGAGLVTAAAVCVAGCVGMPNSGPVGAISVSPQSTNVGGTVIQPFPAGPQSGESPALIVQGFLAASANYPFNAAIARQYLVSSAARTWHPGWSVTVFTNFKPQLRAKSSSHGVEQARVQAQGDVQSAFNGTGQFVSASTSHPAGWTFNLVKVGGQWRISNPPERRLLTVPQFAEFYKAQDLYFYNSAVLPSSQGSPLVPDSVFVPLGTSTTDLLNNLVTALLPSSGQPKSSLLKNAAQTFPAGTTLASSVAQAGSTAVVNLAGLKKAPPAVLEQVSAQLVWTLASPRAGPGAPIQSVELELNGQPYTPPKNICGVTENRSQVQNQATYSCYNPYPAQSASFSFISHGQVWSRCATEASVQRGQVGSVVPVLGASAASLQSCTVNVPTGSIHAPVSGSPGSDAACGTSTLAAVSPDGQYVACYSAAASELFSGLVSGTTLKLVKGVGSGVTALCWDNNHNLWVAANGGDVYMVPDNDQATQVTSAPANVTDLSVAPDGVRIALIVQSGSGPMIDLAAIIHNDPSSQGQHGLLPESLPLSQNLVHLSPGLAQPADLTWYDANDLIVLAGGSSPTLSEVPVDGQAPFGTQPALPGTESISANSALNALVIGVTGDQIAVSTGLEGPWQFLGVHGLNPSYAG
jgi:Lipoprotein LpqB beta-propeller domain/Sporulation and spore germination